MNRSALMKVIEQYRITSAADRADDDQHAGQSSRCDEARFVQCRAAAVRRLTDAGGGDAARRGSDARREVLSLVWPVGVVAGADRVGSSLHLLRGALCRPRQIRRARGAGLRYRDSRRGRQRGAARHDRRDLRARPDGDAGLLEAARTDGADACATAGCIPAMAPIWTRKASSSSSIA